MDNAVLKAKKKGKRDRINIYTGGIVTEKNN